MIMMPGGPDDTHEGTVVMVTKGPRRGSRGDRDAGDEECEAHVSAEDVPDESLLAPVADDVGELVADLDVDVVEWRDLSEDHLGGGGVEQWPPRLVRPLNLLLDVLATDLDLSASQTSICQHHRPRFVSITDFHLSASQTSICQHHRPRFVSITDLHLSEIQTVSPSQYMLE